MTTLYSLGDDLEKFRAELDAATVERDRYRVTLEKTVIDLDEMAEVYSGTNHKLSAAYANWAARLRRVLAGGCPNNDGKSNDCARPQDCPFCSAKKERQ